MNETLEKLPVRIWVTGNMRLEIGGTSVGLSSRKSLALLTYLALQPNQRESRERISTVLWSDSGPDQARGALRTTLRRLKQDLGPAGDLIAADRTELHLAHPVDLDMLEAIRQAEQGRAPAFLSSATGDMTRCLSDIEGLDPDFDLWIAVQRERLGARLVTALEKAMLIASNPMAKLAIAEALERAEPTHEGACRAAMEAYMEIGDTAQAMRAYERLWKRLDEELDVEPSAATQDLYVAIKTGTARPALGGGPAGVDDVLAPIAIVVEPVEGQKLSGDFDFFGTVFRDEMIAALSRFREWLVIDGDQTQGSPPGAYRVYSLRVMLHPVQDSVAVALKLVDSRDSHIVWADRYAVTLDGIAALHRTALRQLAVALNVHLSMPRLLSARDIDSPMGRKYEKWMQAQALASEWRPTSEERANRLLEELIGSIPNFAPAMVALAQSINARPIIFPGQRHTAEQIAECLDLTARAVSIDPLDSRTHLARAWAHSLSGSHSAALSHFDLALDLNENDPWTIISAGLGFAFAGESSRASGLVAQATAFGMRHSRAAQGYIATASYLTGRYATTVSAAEIAGDAIINLPAWHAASLMHLGDPVGAAAAMRRFFELSRENWTRPDVPDDTEIIDWFMGCFPIKSDAVKSELRNRLTEIATL